MARSKFKISTKKWHYKFIKLILTGFVTVPTPQNMHNICPYFWLFIACILLSIFILPVKLIVFLADKLSKFIVGKIVVKPANDWYDHLSDLEVFYIYWENKKMNSMYKYLHYYKSDNIESKTTFIHNWFINKYKKQVFELGSKNYTDDFYKWKQQMHKELYEVKIEQRNKKIEQIKPPSKFQNKIDKLYKNINIKIESFNNWFNNYKITTSWGTIIKRTKQFVSILILLGAVFFIYNFTLLFGYCILLLIENWDWDIFLTVITILTFIGIGLYLTICIIKLINNIDRYGLKLWYVKAIYWPIFIIMYWPMKIIFYEFLYKIIGLSIKKIFNKLKDGVLNYLGIFGSMLFPAYKDFCAELIWEEEEELQI